MESPLLTTNAWLLQAKVSTSLQLDADPRHRPLRLEAKHMGKEFPVAGGTPFLGPQTPGQSICGLNEAQVSRFFGWIHYKAIGQLTGTLDYALIVTASIVAGIGYHSVILEGHTSKSDAVLGAGNIVAALFVLGAASRGNYSPSNIVSARRQVRSIILFWSLAFLSLALFLFLAKSGPDFSRGTIIKFRHARILFVAWFTSLDFRYSQRRAGAGNACGRSSNYYR